jgi:hypothetical protein
MGASPTPDPQVPDTTRRSPLRAERVLVGLHHVLGHDLPNQLVALQGLLQVLALEEGRRLTGEGQLYLSRAAAVARRLSGQVALIKAITRAHQNTGTLEQVALAELAREAGAEIKQLLPGRSITYHLRLGVPAVRTFRRPFQRALVELLHILLSEPGTDSDHIVLLSRAAPDGIELSVEHGAGESSAAPVSAAGFSLSDAVASAAPDLQAALAAQRLALVFVRELSDIWNGNVTMHMEQSRIKAFTLLLAPVP